jgi:anti-sigma28 factor (negative regulator of flagellin synthesis)
MKMLVLFLVLCTTVAYTQAGDPQAAQSVAKAAQVVQLSPADAQQATALYAEQAAVNAKIAALREKISNGYVNSKRVPGQPVISWEFSSDFKFIVLKVN